MHQSNDLATLNAKPKPLTVKGETYQVYPLTLDDFGDLQTWVDAQIPDPIAIVQDRLDQFTPAQQKHLLATALELASRPKPRIGTEQADDLVRSVDGTKELIYISIKKGDPTFTRPRSAALFKQLQMGDIAKILRDTDAEKVLSDPTDPKAETTGT